MGVEKGLSAGIRGGGRYKTTQLWRILVAPRGDYLETRKKLFAGKELRTVYNAAKKFNRK